MWLYVQQHRVLLSIRGDITRRTLTAKLKKIEKKSNYWYNKITLITSSAGCFLTKIGKQLDNGQMWPHIEGY